jgi:ABC-type lipoprotein release transport system permease subunit
MSVVGVIAAVKEDRAAFRSERPAWYVPFPQFESARGLTLVVKTKGDPENAAASVRAAVASVARTVPVYGITTLRESFSAFLSQERFAAVLLSLFAGLGLLLAALGIYGVLSYSLVSRTQEIAILVALGADRRSILTRFLLEGLAVAGSGLALGLAVSAFAARLIGTLLFEVAPADPASFAVTVCVVLGSALLASTLPAQRASRVDPMKALR